MKESVVLHVSVKGLAMAKLRLRCALPLVWLAAKIAGTGFAVDCDGDYAYADGGSAPDSWTMPLLDPDDFKDRPAVLMPIAKADPRA